MSGLEIFLIILAVGVVLLIVVTLSKSVRVVQQQRMDVVERLGRYHRTLRPGLNVLMPYLDRSAPRWTCVSRWSASRRSR